MQIVVLADRGAPAGYLLHQYKRYESSYPPIAARPLPQIIPSLSSLESGTRSPRTENCALPPHRAGDSRQRRRFLHSTHDADTYEFNFSMLVSVRCSFFYSENRRGDPCSKIKGKEFTRGRVRDLVLEEKINPFCQRLCEFGLHPMRNQGKIFLKYHPPSLVVRLFLFKNHSIALLPDSPEE